MTEDSGRREQSQGTGIKMETEKKTTEKENDTTQVKYLPKQEVKRHETDKTLEEKHKHLITMTDRPAPPSFPYAFIFPGR